MDTLWQDVRLALRLMRRSPGFAATVVVTLALGIGANAAIFGVVNGLLLRPLPVLDPHRLVTISSDAAIARGYTAGFGWTAAMWAALQPHADKFDGLLAWTPARFDLAAAGEREPVEGMFVSGGYFQTLGVEAVLGRTFSPEDDRPGGGSLGPVAVISYRLWQRRFGGAPQVIGKALSVDGVATTIVGVAPRGFFGTDVGRAFEVAIPIAIEPLIRGRRPTARPSPLLIVLRLKRDQAITAATATLRQLQPEVLGVTPEGVASIQPSHYREPFTLAAAGAGTSMPVRGPAGLRQIYTRPLQTILMVVLVVLVIACVNVANLMLARGTTRRRELSVRVTLGAPRARLVRQLLVESLVLAAFGAAGALLIASWGSQALVAQFATPNDAVALNVSFDWRTLTFTAAIAVGAVVLFGLLPAWRATGGAAAAARSQAVNSAQRLDAGGTRLVSLSNGLVVAQVALSLALVVAAALLVRSFERLSHVPLGFDPSQVLVVNVALDRMPTDTASRLRLSRELVDAVRRVPGVAHAGASIWTPVDGGMRMGDSESRVAFNFVSPGWLAAYGTAIRRGRDFSDDDTAKAPPVVIVNEAFIGSHMEGRPSLGETVQQPRSRAGGVQRAIVGVVDDAVFDSQREGTQPIVYLPMAQALADRPNGPAEISVGVRPAAGAPMQVARSVGAAITGVDRRLSFTFRVLTDHVATSVQQERIVALLSGAFGGLALLIAALGLYGMTAYAVGRRSGEIGIRMALGARRTHVMRLVFGQSLTLAAAGIALGLAAAFAATQTLSGMLFGLTPFDPSTFVSVAALFAIVAAVASSIPAYPGHEGGPVRFVAS